MPNMTRAFEFFNKKYRAAFVPPAVMGIAKDYKVVSKWLDDNLIPGPLAAEFRRTETQCFDGNQIYAYKDIGQYFKRGWLSLFDKEVREVMEHTGTLGLRSTPTIPWYLHEVCFRIQGVCGRYLTVVMQTYWDDISPIELTDELVKKHCANGAHIQVNGHYISVRKVPLTR